MAKIRTGFSGYKDADLSVKAAVIIASLTGNPNFANPVPPLADVQAALTAFDTALTNMGTGNKDATVIKNRCRATLEALLTDLGLFVQLHSKGDEAKLLTSGYDLVSKPVPYGVLPKPQNFKVVPGDARGSVKASMNSIDGASGYLYEYTKAPVVPDSIWTPITVPRISVVIDNLVSGDEYYFRGTGIGANPTKVYSDEISSFVL